MAKYGLGPRAKTKTVLKSVSKWAQFGSMQNLKFKTFLNKNPPNIPFPVKGFIITAIIIFVIIIIFTTIVKLVEANIKDHYL